LCIDTDYVKALLKNLIRCISVAEDAVEDKNEKLYMLVQEEFKACYTALECHMEGIRMEDGTFDEDALSHSLSPGIPLKFTILKEVIEVGS